MRSGAAVFVDTGGWVALALVRDPLHDRAVAAWARVAAAGAKVLTSVPVVLETFTFLDRNTQRDVALGWQQALSTIPRFRIVECTKKDLEASWAYFDRKELHKLSAVDATSFAIMRRLDVRDVLTFDHHFAQVGFRMI